MKGLLDALQYLIYGEKDRITNIGDTYQESRIKSKAKSREIPSTRKSALLLVLCLILA